MNPEEQELQQLEQHLQQLVPTEPGEALTARIFAAFETPSDAAPPAVENVTPLPTQDSKPNPWFQPFAAAAAVALIAGIVALVGLSRPNQVAEPEAANNYAPSHAQNTYRGSDVEGIVFTEDQQALQTVRHQFIDTYTWENAADGSRIEVKVPVERVRYIPVETD